ARHETWIAGCQRVDLGSATGLLAATGLLLRHHLLVLRLAGPQGLALLRDRGLALPDAAALRIEQAVESLQRLGHVERLPRLLSTSIAGYWLRAAILRDRIMWPSRMPRTSSAIGSLPLSSSASTVYSAVIDPRAPMPARSSSRGISANTEGG